MSLRVIAGRHGGRVLKSVRGQGTRPLLGQVREALFGILDDEVVGAEVWDLFAGTGVTGIEALSRGARRVCFVEKSNQALAALRANLELLGEEERSVVVKGDAWNPPSEGEDGWFRPSIIFLDPPYAAVSEDPVRAAYRARSLARRLQPGGALCFHFREGALDVDDFDQELSVDLRVWGGSAVALIRAAGG